MNGDWIAIAGGISAVVVALSIVVGFIVKHAAPRIRDLRQFVQRVTGVAANPKTGQEYIPSLWELIGELSANLDSRLDQQDQVLARQDAVLDRQNEVLETIRHEVQYNSGTSVKDAVRRIEGHLKDQSSNPKD